MLLGSLDVRWEYPSKIYDWSLIIVWLKNDRNIVGNTNVRTWEWYL